MSLVDESVASGVVNQSRRAPDSLLALGVAISVGILGLIAAWLGVHFFYVGDNPESFIPLWHHFGTLLRSGEWPTMEPSGWMGGNYVGEAAYAQWNPILLALYVAVSLFNDMALGATAAMVSLLSLLGAGSYLLMRAYGARQAAAVALSVAVPVTGFTLSYEAAGWPAGLAAFTGVTYFWLAVRKQSVNSWPPAATFLFGYLAVTTGNPYALLGVLAVLAGSFVELLIAKSWRRSVELVITGLLVGVISLLVFLPLLGVQPVTVRQELAGIVNDTFLVPDLGDLAASSTPSYLPTITNWGGALVESLPSVYLAWFALPLLPWIRWRALWSDLRVRSSVLVVGGLYALAVLGPSNLWLFRWPIRLVEYLYLAILVILAIAVSRGIHSVSRTRIAASSAIILFGSFLAVSTTPSGIRLHIIALVLVSVLFLSLVIAMQRRGLAAGAGILVAGIFVVTAFQAAVYPQGARTFIVPSNISEMTAQSEQFEGRVFQLAQQSLAGPDAINSAALLFGNLSAPLGYESVNRYSGISFRSFAEFMCIDYKGNTCPETFERLWQPVEETDGSVADAIGVGTLVLQRAAYPDAITEGPPSGWHVAESDPIRVVWVRDTPLVPNGRVSATSPGVTARSATSNPTEETVEVSSDSGGVVTFARLAWPGYSVSINGEPATYQQTPQGLMQVQVPPGDSLLQLRYSAPGLQLGAVMTAIAAALALVQSVWWLSRRWRREHTPSTATENLSPGAQ